MKNFIQDSGGQFGPFGGCFAPELLQPVIKRIEKIFEDLIVCAYLSNNLNEAISLINQITISYPRYINKNKLTLGPNQLYFSYYPNTIQKELDQCRKVWKRKFADEKRNLEKTE